MTCAAVGGIVLGTAAAAGDAGPPTEAVIVEARADSTPAFAQLSPLQFPSTTEAPTTSTSAAASTASAPTTESPSTASTAAPTTTTTAAPPPSTTTTAPPPPPPPPSGSPEEAIAHWFPDVYDKAVAVAQCESSMDPGAVSSGGGNHGLFQINTVHQSSFEAVTGVAWSDGIYVAEHNAHFARWLYDDQGWEPWACA